MRNKILSVKDYTVDHDIDIFALTETWLEPGDSDRLLIEELIPSDYRFLHNPRSIGRGGGVGMLFKNSLRVKQEETIVTDSFEYMQIICNTSTKSFRIIVIYRPPNGSFANFCLDFSGLLERLSTFGSLLLITGDFNIHLDQPEVPSASKFQRLLKSFGLIQHVHSPTHRSQHTLDLLITRSSDCTLSDIHVHDMGLSDHFAVHSVLPLAKPPRETKRIVYRKIRRIDLASFSSDLQACLAITPAKDLSAFIDHYNTTLQDILSKHAPEKTKVITVRASAPRHPDKIDAGKNLRRMLERRWRKTKSLDDYNAYLLQRRRVQSSIPSSKSDYYTPTIDENCANQKTLYKIKDHLLNRKATPQLPSLSPDDLPGKFATFFTDKIVSIRNGLSTYGDDDHQTIPAASTR